MNLSLRYELVTVQPVVLFKEQPVPVDILRLDRIHPVVSGNKWFKLKEWLDIAEKQKNIGLITAGGAYSNHIVATAFAAKTVGLQSAAIVRGEATNNESPSLQEARAYGMTIEYVDRGSYTQLKTGLAGTNIVPENWLFIPEGGEGPVGVKGASAMLDLVPSVHEYSHICCSVGTGTMLAGLANAALPHQQILGISSLKGEDTISMKIKDWLLPSAASFTINHDFHFGGYAKHPQTLLDFMNALFTETAIPTDIVYTGKMMFALRSIIKNSYFRETDRILAIHSGGVQGNRSLNKGQLIFL